MPPDLPLVTAARAGDVEAVGRSIASTTSPRQAQLALDAGADVAAFGVALIDLLLARGAPTDARGRIWNGTPLHWAIDERRAGAEATGDRVSDRATSPTVPLSEAPRAR